MPTTDHQRSVFLALKHDLQNDGCWLSFHKEWDGFINAIFKRRLWFAPSLWEDAMGEVEVRVFRYIGRFDEAREASPWLARVVVSACETVKKESGNGPRSVSTEPIDTLSGAEEPDKLSEQGGDSRGDISFDDWVTSALEAGNGRDAELTGDVWFCVNEALDSCIKDKRMVTAFYMFYREDYSLREIAEIFRMKQSTVNNWPGYVLKRIMPEVKAALSELGYAPEGYRASTSTQ
jgi:DNA-directed RNA polymerase specialized sigma24 family protein